MDLLGSHYSLDTLVLVVLRSQILITDLWLVVLLGSHYLLDQLVKGSAVAQW